jgi:hypothetical protein
VETLETGEHMASHIPRRRTSVVANKIATRSSKKSPRSAPGLRGQAELHRILERSAKAGEAAARATNNGNVAIARLAGGIVQLAKQIGRLATAINRAGRI